MQEGLYLVKSPESSNPPLSCSEASCRSSRWKTCQWKHPGATVVIPDGEKGDRLGRKLGSKSLGRLG